MTETEQLRDDLKYVRQAVGRRAPLAGKTAYSYYFAAIYVLIGYVLIDFRPQIAGPYFILALAPMVIVRMLGGRNGLAPGEIDRARASRQFMHWMCGIWGSIIFGVALQWSIPSLRGVPGGQVMLVLFGMVYLLWGVHYDRSFLILGPIMMIGGVVITFIPHYPWTSMGMIIAAGLVAAGMRLQYATTNSRESA